MATGQPSHHADEEAWFEYRLQHDPRFQRRIAEARASLRYGRGTHLEDLVDEAVGEQDAQPPS